MYNVKKQIFDELSKDVLPEGLSTLFDLRASQVIFNEIVKNGNGFTVVSEVKDFFQKFGADVSESQNGFKISFETAEKKQKYYNLLQEVYKDGDIEGYEKESLKQLQVQLGLSDSQVKSIEKNFVKPEKENKIENISQDKNKKKKKKPPLHCRECLHEKSR